VPDSHAHLARLVRYAATSLVAFGLSEATLLILYGSGVLDATVAALIANLVGTVPSYVMSRYWIWRDATRTHVGRQLVLYWSTSIACIAGTSLATGAIANLAPAGHRFHLASVGIGFLAVSVTFWFAKFVIYQRLIFPVPKAEAGDTSSAGLNNGRRPGRDDDELYGPPSCAVHHPATDGHNIRNPHPNLPEPPTPMERGDLNSQQRRNDRLHDTRTRRRQGDSQLVGERLRRFGSRGV
jgi:putative flippase GtrA